jgi:galacturonokinase
MDNIIASLRARMHDLYRVDPSAVRFVCSPYRVCPLGAHIDHQLGTVTALTINQAVHLAYVPSGSLIIHLASQDYDGEVQFQVDQIPGKINGDWGNYARGAAQALTRHGPLRQGILGLISGAWGEGGLSSSAAVGVAYLLALEEVNQLSISRAENIRLDQIIENQYLGLNNGILDQSAILCSRRRHLTVIDCQAFVIQTGPLPEASPPPGIDLIAQPNEMPPFVLLIVFSGLTKSVVTTAYNLRVQECAAAARTLLAAVGRPDAPTILGNVSVAEYQAGRQRLSGPLAKRAAHYFGEMARVREGLTAWRQGDLVRFGQLMNESGQSSIGNYECGSPPLIDLSHILRQIPGVYGARFSGAGFRGCCVALADPEAARLAGPEILKAYAKRHPSLGARARVCVCEPDDHARLIANRITNDK